MENGAMTIGRVKKLSLYSFIVFLAISALFAIVTVVAGSFGEFEAKVIVSTLVVAVASVCSLCCSAYSARTGITWPGVAGMALAVVSALMVIVGVWTEMDSEPYWKTAIIMGLFTWASAHALALLTVRLPPRHRWLQVATTVNILLVGGILSIMILGEIEAEGMFKLVAVLAILAALETLVVPILGKLTRAAAEPAPGREVLELTRRGDGRYEDGKGQVYRVERLQEKEEDLHQG